MKRRRMIYIVFLCLFFFLTAPLLNAAAQSAPPKTIRVGYFLLSGYHNLSPSGYRSGYGYEYLHEIARYTGWNYEYVPGTWNECLEMLREGKIDLLTSAYRSPARENLYDFTELPIGLNYAMLTEKSDTASPGGNDRSTFNGIRIGIQQGDNSAEAVKKFSLAMRFSYTPLYFQSEDALRQALADEEVDAILSDGLRLIRGEKIIAKFTPAPFYCIVKKGDATLLSELNQALESLKTDNPQIDSRLYSKYYGAIGSNATNLTPEERSYLHEKQTLRAVASPGRAPLSYFQDGQYQGIFADIMKKLSEELDVEIQYIETSSYEESLQKLKNGEADILCDFFSDYDWAEKNGLAITFPYLDMQYSAIMQKNALSIHPLDRDPSGARDATVKESFAFDNLTVATGDNYFFNQVFIAENFSPGQIFHHQTEKECLEAVLSGKQNVTFLNTYVAEKILRANEYNRLSAFLIPNFKHSVSIAMLQHANPLLRSSLNKSVLHLGKNPTDAIVAKHVMFQPSHVTLLDYFYQNPIPVIFGSSLVFCLIISILVYTLLERRKYMRHIYELAYFDGFTGLWNTNKFETEAARRIKENQGRKYAMFAFDISHFDVINESYGRNIGDKIITLAAAALRATHCANARVKADHFLLLFPYAVAADLDAMIGRLRQALHHYEENEIHILLTLNIGIYLLPDADTAITSAIDAAEIARKEAKNKKEACAYFDHLIESKLLREKEIEDKMLQALKEKCFHVYYQPKYDMRTHAIIGAEALVRWIDKDHGLMPPADFVPIFEQNGFIIEIDFFVLEEVCKFLRDRLDAGEAPLQISVNQSQIHFSEEHYINRLAGVMKKYRIPPKVIELELTETAFIEYSKAQATIADLRALGFLLSIDDFGAGYSSITMLNALPLDVMKIDKALLTESDNSGRTRKIIKKIVELGLELDMQVICEGVEEKKQSEFLMSVGCNYAQGFLYAKPMPEEDFKKLLIK